MCMYLFIYIYRLHLLYGENVCINTIHCNTLQHITTHCNALQHITKHCNTLQHTATHCNTV